MSSTLPTIIPPQAAESKRDRKRRETVNKIEMLHDESWRNRDDKFQNLYKEYHTENKAVNSQPPTSAKYLLRLYPATIERDALLESAEVEYQYKAGQAKKMYESERESIEASYWDARDQVRQRLLGAIEERRRKLKEEKEGGDIVTEALLDAQIKVRPKRRKLFHRPESSASSSRSSTSTSIQLRSTSPPNPLKPNDILLHSLLAPALAQISTDDILSTSSSSLSVIPAPSTLNPVPVQGAKRGPRAKGDGGEKGEGLPALGTVTALGVASGQVVPAVGGGAGGRARGAGAERNQAQWVLGKSLADLRKMESASQLEMDSDWARIQGIGGRGRRARGD